MSIRNRMRYLEDKITTCTECRDTPPTIQVVYPGDQEPEPKHCPKCDRSLSVLIRVEYDG